MTDCPACKGTGDDPDGCGCQCTDIDHNSLDGCPKGLLGCVYCLCHGCGGSCPWCGGTGIKEDWKKGNPEYE